MVRKQKNTRALIKKRNKQDGGGFRSIFKLMMTGKTSANVVAPTPGQIIDPRLRKLINSENVEIDEQRFFSRIKKILLKEVPVVNIEIEKAEQVKDKLIRITTSFKEKLSIFIESVKKKIIENHIKSI